MSKGSPRGGKRRSAQSSGARGAPATSSKSTTSATGAAPASSKSTAVTDHAPASAPAPKSPAARQRSSSRRRRSRVPWFGILAGIGALALIGVVIYNIAREVQVVAGVQTYGPFPANVHVTTDVTYPQTPPTGGEHRATWQNCGIYSLPVEDELAVHAMEHGAVWLTYQPDLPPEQVEQLKSLVRGKPYTLLSPYEGMSSPIAASGWGVQLLADSADDARLGQFIAKYRQGSQTPEQGAPCVGGAGSPDES
jgi:hypothetical protein